MTALVAPAVDEAAEPGITIIPGRRPESLSRRTRVVRWVRRRQVPLAVAGAGVSAAFVVFSFWFRTGMFYARGDLAPFVRDGLRAELGGQWTHQSRGAGGPSYELVRLVELAFLNVAHFVGGGDALGQRLLFAAIFAFAASGVAAFAARVVKRPWLVLLAGLLGAFAPLVMVNLPNFLLPVCIGLVGWTAAVAFDAAAAGKSRPRAFALLTLALSYLALNPALLAVAVMWIALLPLAAPLGTATGIPGARRTVRLLTRAAAWAVPLSLWWFVPYAFAMRGAAATGTINANTDVLSWSWTHAHGSFDRVLMLVAKWSWPEPKFASNASSLASGGWLWLAIALPVGLIIAPLVARTEWRRRALWLLGVVLVLAFVGKGLNAPGRSVNAFLYRIPGSWLLREPMGKVGALMVPLVIVAWVIAVDGLVVRTRGVRRARFARVATTILIVAPLLFALPMLTGGVVSNDDRVRVPAAWHQVARIVDDGPGPGKALVLPLDDFYQVPTTWGYYGTDTVPGQTITRPTIVRNPQSYIGEPGAFDALVQAVQIGVVGGDPSAVPGALRALGVSYIVVRRDIDHASRVRTVDMPTADILTAGLAAVPGVRQVGATAVADVYEVTDGGELVEAMSGTIAAPGIRGAALASLVAAAPVHTGITTAKPSDAPLLAGQAWYLDVNGGRRVTPLAAGDFVYQRRASGPALLELKSDAQGLVLHEPVAIRVGKTTLASRPDEHVRGTGPAAAAQLDDDLYDLANGDVYARVAPGARVTSYARAGGNRLGTWSEVGDCNRYDDLEAGAAGLDAGPLQTATGPGLRLRAVKHSACVWASVSDVNPNDLVRVAFEQHTQQGAPPRACLWEQSNRACAPLEWTVTRRGGWYALSALYRVQAPAGPIKLFLYADEPPSHESATEAWYRDVSVERFVAGPTRVVGPAPLPAGRVHLDGKPVAVTTTVQSVQPVLGAQARVGDCARVDDRSLADLGISATVLPDQPAAIQLSARAHRGCISMPLTGLRPGVTYEVSFDARVVRGADPRVCLWQDTADRCARFVPISAPTSGVGRYRYRGHIDGNATAVRVYLYADARAEATTINYRDVRVRPVADESLVLRSATVADSPRPEVTSTRSSSSSYDVRVHEVSRPFVLALSDAFAKGWRVEGLPKGARAAPIEIDGYRSGWVIDAVGDLHIKIVYAPARVGHLAMTVSLLTLLVVVASIPLAPGLTRLRRRWWARRSQARREGPRRILLPDSWPTGGLDAE